jgi:hypothetical protein
MPSNWKQRVLAAVAVAAVASAIVLAIVGTGGSHHRHGHRGGHGTRARANAANVRRGAALDIDVAARYLGIGKAQLRRQMRSGKTLGVIAAATPGKSAAGVIEAIVASRSSRITAAIAAGTLSKSDQAARLAQVRRRATIVVYRPASASLIDLQSAATYLGVTPARVVAQMRSTRSLAELADSIHGRSASALITTLVAARRSEIKQTTAAGLLSPARERATLATLPQRVSAAVHRVRVAHPRAARHRQHHASKQAAPSNR